MGFSIPGQGKPNTQGFFVRRDGANMATGVYTPDGVDLEAYAREMVATIPGLIGCSLYKREVGQAVAFDARHAPLAIEGLRNAALRVLLESREEKGKAA